MTSTASSAASGFGEHGGVAKQAVKFGKDELGDGHLLLALKGGQPAERVRVAGRVRVEGVEQDVRVNGQHGVSGGAWAWGQS